MPLDSSPPRRRRDDCPIEVLMAHCIPLFQEKLGRELTDRELAMMRRALIDGIEAEIQRQKSLGGTG